MSSSESNHIGHIGKMLTYLFTASYAIIFVLGSLHAAVYGKSTAMRLAAGFCLGISCDILGIFTTVVWIRNHYRLEKT